MLSLRPFLTGTVEKVHISEPGHSVTWEDKDTPLSTTCFLVCVFQERRWREEKKSKIYIFHYTQNRADQGRAVGGSVVLWTEHELL